MNLPNKLTVLRMALIPVFLLFMLVEGLPQRYLLAAVLFGAASYTDYLDGHIARRDGLVTNFGKLMDPLADKLLVFSALICFIPLKMAYPLVVFILLARELLVTSVRLIAAEQGTVISADRWGKVKTVFQIIWVLVVLVTLWLEGDGMRLLFAGAFSALGGGILAVLSWGAWVLQFVVVGLTVFSGWNYVWKNRGLLSDIK